MKSSEKPPIPNLRYDTSPNIMTTLQKIITTLIFTTLCSCSHSSANKTETAQNGSMVVETMDTANQTNNSATFTNDETEADTITTLKFKELSISINRLVVYDEDKKMEQIQKDTVELYLELGETIEGQLISISSDQLANFTIEQRYETSVTIMNEGPHCDLTDWKHFYSAWKQLQANSLGQFTCEKYTEKECEKFPKIQIDDLKQKVKEHCGDEWFKHVEKVKTPTEYPSGVGISRYYLRVTGHRKDNRQTVTKLIVIETPMGC